MNFKGGGQPIESSATTTVAIVLGILLGVAVLVLLALGVLHYRNKSGKLDMHPPSISYKNGGSVNPPDLSTDVGIDNPSYKSAPFTNA